VVMIDGCDLVCFHSFSSPGLASLFPSVRGGFKAMLELKRVLRFFLHLVFFFSFSPLRVCGAQNAGAERTFFRFFSPPLRLFLSSLFRASSAVAGAMLRRVNEKLFEGCARSVSFSFFFPLKSFSFLQRDMISKSSRLSSDPRVSLSFFFPSLPSPLSPSSFPGPGPTLGKTLLAGGRSALGQIGPTR